jgi:hypothetical protein
MEPRYQTAGARKDARRRIRNTLGTSRDPAPDAVKALRAAGDLHELLRDASDGRFELVLRDNQGECTRLTGMINVARGLTPGGTQR